MIDSWRHLRAFLPTPQLAFYAVYTLVAIALVAYARHGAHETQRVDQKARQRQLVNCRKIEEVKTFIRQTVAYDPKAYTASLVALHIDPTSPTGKTLARQAEIRARQLQRRFRAKPCNPF